MHRSSFTLAAAIRRPPEMRAELCPRAGNCMRTLLIGPLFATLIGCSCPVPPRAMLDGCTSYDCFERTAVSEPIQLKPAPAKPSSAAPKKKPIASANTAKPLPAKPVKSTSLAEGKAPSIAVVPASGQPSETASGQPSETAEFRPKKSKGHDRSENGESDIGRVRRYKAGHEKKYIRATGRHHLWPRQREKTVG